MPRNTRGMKDVEVYDAEWYEKRRKGRDGTVNFGEIVGKYLHVDYVIDLGCGDGNWLVGWDKIGVPCIGIDFSVGFSDAFVLPKSKLLIHNLEEKLPESFLKIVEYVEGVLLVQSFETAEHIHRGAVDIYLDNLVCANTDIIFFTAAAPGQIGTRHHVLEPMDWWVEKINSRGYAVNRLATCMLQDIMFCIGKIPSFYRKNLVVFERE